MDFHTSNYYRYGPSQPALTGKSAAIAEAARNAGFPTWDWDSLRDLINAVKAADVATTPRIYPDYYNGQALGQIKNRHYPEGWVSARLRRKIGVARSHQDTNHRPCVPAFVVPAEQIIESLNVSSGLEQMHPARRVQATTTTTRSVTTSHITSFGGARQGSGANSEPVRAHNKRGMGETGMWDPLTKRMKIEEGHDRRIINEENLIDLTEDDHDTSPRFRSSRTPPRDVTDTKNRSRSDLSNIITTSRVFNKIERQLRASEAEFGEIRNVLKNQWEVDVNLQQDDVTKQLLDMNNQLTNAEVSVRNVIAVMQVIPV